MKLRKEKKLTGITPRKIYQTVDFCSKRRICVIWKCILGSNIKKYGTAVTIALLRRTKQNSECQHSMVVSCRCSQSCNNVAEKRGDHLEPHCLIQLVPLHIKNIKLHVFAIYRAVITVHRNLVIFSTTASISRTGHPDLPTLLSWIYWSLSQCSHQLSSSYLDSHPFHSAAP